MPRHLAFSLCCLALLGGGCRTRRAALVSEIDLMNKTPEQRLLRGFYPIAEKLRWTQPRFAVSLDPPRTERPVYMELEFFLPEELMGQVRTVTLIATMNGIELGRQTYYTTGRYALACFVPVRALAKQPSEVEIEMDRAAALPGNSRTIGLLALSIGLKEYERTAEYRETQAWIAREGYRQTVERRRLKLPPAKELELRKLYAGLPLWENVRFQNVPLNKNPLDLWMLQQILFEARPDLIVVAGAGNGGLALYLAQALDGMNMTRSKVIAVDPANAVAPEARAHFLAPKYIEFPRGAAADPQIVSAIAARAKGKPTLVILDGESSAERVRELLKLYAPLVSSGSYLIVQGTHRDAVPLQSEASPGPFAAVRQFLSDDGGGELFEQDAGREELIFTFNPGGWLRRK